MYTYEGSYQKALRKNTKCHSCCSIDPNTTDGPKERNCPDCGILLTYTTKFACLAAQQAHTKCKSCSMKKGGIPDPPYERNCPECAVTISYKSWWTLQSAVREGTRCISCRSVRVGLVKSKELYIGQKFGSLTVIDLTQGIDRVQKKLDIMAHTSCDCGRTHIVRLGSLLNGTCTRCKSCACRKRGDSLRGVDPYWSNKIKVLYQYKKHAKTRGVSWALTDQEALTLFESPCFYCGSKGSNTNVVRRKTLESRIWSYNGIDRKNSDLGYTMDNVVACCRTCNRAKADLTIDQFIQWIKQLTLKSEGATNKG